MREVRVDINIMRNQVTREGERGGRECGEGEDGVV
jgi:hypothetical protein